MDEMEKNQEFIAELVERQEPRSGLLKAFLSAGSMNWLLQSSTHFLARNWQRALQNRLWKKRIWGVSTPRCPS